VSDPTLLFRVFVPGKVRRQDNGSQGSWRAKAGYRKAWRTRVKLHLMQHRHLKIDPTTPKTVRLIANVFNLYDAAGLAAALKPVEDGVVDGGIIHSDQTRERSGHAILHAQRIDRTMEGVLIDVREGVDLV